MRQGGVFLIVLLDDSIVLHGECIAPSLVSADWRMCPRSFGHCHLLTLPTPAHQHLSSYMCTGGCGAARGRVGWEPRQRRENGKRRGGVWRYAENGGRTVER